MKDRATGTRKFAARVAMVAAVMLLLASLGLASDRSNQKKNNVVSNVTPSACGLTSGTSNPAGGISGHTGTLYYQGSWVGNFNGTDYDAAMIDHFTYSSGSTGTFMGALTYGLLGQNGGSALSLAGTWTIGSNCVGSITLNSESPFYTVAFVYLPTVGQIQMIQTDGLGSMSHTETVASSANPSYPTCDSDDLDGTFSGVWTGSYSSFTYDANLVGVVVTSPAQFSSGTLNYNILNSSAGAQTVGPSAQVHATYTITSNCTGTITLTGSDVGANFTYAASWHDQFSIAETDGQGLAAATLYDLTF